MKLIFLLTAIVMLSSTSSAVEITGVVKSEDGKPLAGVQIKTHAPAGPAKIFGIQVAESTKDFEATTDASGAFKLPAHGRVIYFHRDDLRPLALIVALELQQIEATMEVGSRSLWKIPACTANDKATRAGVGFMVTSAPNVMVRKDTDRFENGGYFFGYQAGPKVELMVNWWESTSLHPQEEFLIESREFSLRKWSSGEKWGYEYRGIMPDGKMWRRVTLKNGALAYQGLSKEAAGAFDQMIDDMCFDASAVTW